MFNYFTHSIVLIFIGYASIYPLFFWITPLKKIDQGFYRFNLGKCCVIGSLGVIANHFISINQALQLPAYMWIVALMIITAIYWNRESVSNAILTLISLVGCYSLVLIADQFIDYSVFYVSSFSILIGSAITAGVFFSMILGHWYLNVIALPISLLKKSTITLWIALLIRSLWDLFYFATTQHTDSYGIEKDLWQFLFEFDGLLLLVAFFMGNIFPIIINYFVWKTLQLQATQSATGLLYVSIVSVLFGDIIYKYYLLQYGFAL